MINDNSSGSDLYKSMLKTGEKIIQDEFGDSKQFAIKDPRCCLLLPFWKAVFQNLGVELKMIAINIFISRKKNRLIMVWFASS